MIRTARLTLRRFRETDVDDALAYRDDREFARYLPHIPQPFTRVDAEAFVHVNMTEPWDSTRRWREGGDGLGRLTLSATAMVATSLA